MQKCDRDRLKPLLAGFNSAQQTSLTNEYDGATAETQEALLRALGIASERINELEAEALLGRTCKKQKLDHQSGGHLSGSAASATVGHALATIHNVSLVLPLRRRLDICLCSSGLQAKYPAASGPSTVDGPCLLWEQVRLPLCLPTPGKAQPTWTVLLLGPAEGEAIAFQLPDKPRANVTVHDSALLDQIPGPAEVGSNEQFLHWLFGCLPGQNSISLQRPMAIGRGTQQTGYARCYVKGQEGYLFVLAEGVLYGLRKPVVYIPYSQLVSIQMVPSGMRGFDIVAVTAGATWQFCLFDNQDSWLGQHVQGAWKKSRKAEKAKQQAGPGAGTIGCKASQEAVADSSEDESDDSDFVPEGPGEDVGEELDEDYGSSQGESGGWEESDDEGEAGRPQEDEPHSAGRGTKASTGSDED